MLSQSVFGVLIVITCFACYYNSINCGFVFDDISAIKENKDLRPHSPWRNIFANDFWGTPMQKVSFRVRPILGFRLIRNLVEIRDVHTFLLIPSSGGYFAKGALSLNWARYKGRGGGRWWRRNIRIKCTKPKK